MKMACRCVVILFLAVLSQSMILYSMQMNDRKRARTGDSTSQSSIELEGLITEEADKSASEYGVWSPLGCAIDKGQVDEVKSLLSSKADPNSSVVLNTHPLIFAVTSNSPHRVEIMQSLLDGKANIEARQPVSGKTALCLAVENNAVKEAELLLWHKANVNIVSGNSLLKIAVIRGHDDVIPYLAYYGLESDVQAVLNLLMPYKVSLAIKEKAMADCIAARNNKTMSIINDVLVTKKIGIDQLWTPEQLREVLVKNVPLLLVLVDIIDSYASFASEHKEVDGMVRALIARNQKK